MNTSVIQGSVALNAAFLGSTTTNAMATPIHRLPVVVPGRYINASSKQMVQVVLVDAKGVHYFELVGQEDDPTIYEHRGESKSMNTAVFALTHQPV